MASKGYTIAIATDTRLFEQGVRMGIIKPTEDADEALTDLGKNKGPAQLEDGLRDAQRATDKLGDETRQMTEQAQRDYRAMALAEKKSTDDAGSHFELSSREKTKISKETIHEIGNEAKQNAAETFSSFDGSAQSFVDGVQGTLGGLVSSLGPLGLAAGAAGALGIGLINGALGKADEQTAQFRQDVADLATDLIETGDTGKQSIGYMVDQLKKLATETDPNAVNLKKIHDQAKSLGVPFKDLALAYAHGTDAIDSQIEALKKHKAEVDKNGAAYDNFSSAMGGAHSAETSAIEDQILALKKVKKENTEAAEEARLYGQTGAAAMQQADDAAQTMAEGVQSSLEDAGNSWEDYTKNGVVNLDQYNAAIEKQARAMTDYESNVVKASSSLSQEALSYIESLGPQAAPLLQAFVDAPIAEQARTAKNWALLGKTAGTSYTADLKTNIPGSINGPKVKLGVDRAAYDTAVASIQNGVVKINVAGITRTGNRVF